MIVFPGKTFCNVPENYPFFPLLPESENFEGSNRLNQSEEKEPTRVFGKDLQELRNETNWERETELISILNLEEMSAVNFFSLHFEKNYKVHSTLKNRILQKSKIHCSELIRRESFSRGFSENILAMGTDYGNISLVSIDKNFLEKSNEITTFSQDSRNQKKSFRYFSQSRYVTNLSWNKLFSNLLLSGSNKGIIKCWNLKEGKEILKMKNPGNIVSCLQWSPFQKTEFLFLLGNSMVGFSDIRCGNNCKIITTTNDFHSVCWTGYDHLFMAAEKKGKIRLFDRRNLGSDLIKFQLYSFQGSREEIKIFSISPRGKNLLIVGEKGKVETWTFLNQTKFQKNSPNINLSHQSSQFQWIENFPEEKIIALNQEQTFSIIDSMVQKDSRL